MIKAIIIDDEHKSVTTLSAFLREYCPVVEVVATANDIERGKMLIAEQVPQLVFLDIQMPYGSGFDLLEALPIVNFETIFITAYDSFAVRAFHCSAIDYLLKPLNIRELQKAVSKAEERIREKMAGQNYSLLLQNLKEGDILQRKILIRDRGRSDIVSFNDIIYCIAEGSYTKIYTASVQYTCSKNLKTYEAILPENVFCRIHHGHIINVNHISKIGAGRSSVITMNDGKQLEIAVRRKETLRLLIAK